MSELISVTEQDVRAAFEAGCSECIKIGSTWVNLRMCMICGKTGCCDSSPMKHASQHFTDTGHTHARSIQPGEDWIWDFSTQEMAE